MEFHSTPPKSIRSPLDELLLGFYDAVTVRRLYTENLLPAQGKSPEKKPPKKGDIAKALLAAAADEALTEKFVAQFDGSLREAIGLLLWVQQMPLNELEALLGHEIARIEKFQRRAYHPCNAKLHQENYLLVLWRKERRYYGYDPEADTDHSNYLVCLPPALRNWLKPYFPKPAGYYLEGTSEMPGKWTTFNCADSAIQDSVDTADFIQRGGVQRSKSLKLSRKSLKALTATTRGGEPYAPETKITALLYFRHALLIDFIEGLPDRLFQKLAAASVEPELFLKSIPKELAADAEQMLPKILPHLRAQRSGYWHEPDVSAAKFGELIALFGEIPVGQWVDRQALLSYCRLHEIDGCFFNLSSFDVQMSIETDDNRGYGFSCYRRDIDYEHIEGVVTWPAISGLALCLSALGLLEIGHSDPYNRRFRAKDKPYLSPLEGVQTVRLTDLGAYAFGKIEQLKLPELESSALELHFHPERLHLKVVNSDPITEKTLSTYMESIGAGIYKISRESFLKGCESKRQLSTHIEQFKRSIPAELPENWETFFKDLEDEPAVLKREVHWTLYRLPENEAVRRAFALDPELCQHCRKVEGWRVAIPTDQVKLVEKRLRKLGFFPH